MDPETKNDKPTKEILEDGEETTEFLAMLDDQVAKHPVVTTHHGKWKELLEWCDKGNQYSEWNSDDNKIMDVKPLMKKRRRHVVVNLMKPLTEVLDSKLNMNYLIEGFPNSSEVKDVAGAKVATKLLSHNSYVNNEEALWEDFKYWLIRIGNAFVKQTWDISAYGKIKREKKGGSDVVEQEGEVIMSVPCPFNIRWDPAAKDIEHARWMMDIDEVTEEDIVQNFDITQEELDALPADGQSGEKYVGMYEKEEDKDPDEKTRIIRYYWERKSAKYPRGRHIIAIPGKVLWKKTNPALGELPFWYTYFKRDGNSFVGTGALFHVQPIQRIFNRLNSVILEHIEAWRPKMMVGPGALIKDGAFTTDTAEILEVDSSRGEPRPMNTPPLDSQVLAFRDYMAGALNQVANVHEVSYSQLPQYSSRAPASLFSMMLEQENIKIDPLIKRLNKMILSMAKFRLRLMDEYYDQPRLVKVIGIGQETSIEYFKGADLNGNFDVKLAIGVSLHQSKIVQQRLLMELKQNGVIADNNKLLKLLNMGNIETELRGDVADEERAIRENQQFVSDTYAATRDQGGVFVYVHDNHEVHLDYHTNLSKTEEAQRWPEPKWQALQAHIAEHYQYIQAVQQAQAMTQGGAPGASANTATGGTTGVPPPPAETMAEGAPSEPEVAQERELNMVT